MLINNKIMRLGLIAGLAATVALTSCHSKNSVVRADDYDAETIVDLMNQESPRVNANDYLGAKHVDKHGNAITQHTPVEGEWIIIEAGGKKVVQDGDMPYVIFSDVDSRFYANNGCNGINGDFAYDTEEATLTFSDVLSTMASCPDIPYQHDISVVLNDGVTVKTRIESKGQESYMYITSKSDDKLMTLRRHNMEVLNGQWDVKEINGKKIDVNGLNIFLDLPELSVHGNTGCNYFNGKIEVDPFAASSISFTNMGVTMRMCENSDLERKMLVALEQVTAYKLKDHDTLQLVGSDGKCLMTLKRDTTL